MNTEIAVFILAVIGCILCHSLATAYNQRIEKKYCRGCINWWSAGVAVLLAAAILTIGEDSFWIFLLLVLCGAGVSAYLCYRKMIDWGATAKEAGLGSAAQVASVVGIAAAILFVLLLLFGGSSKKRRRR